MYRQKSYPGLDIVKLLMAICVVAIHTQPLVNCTNSLLLKFYEMIVNGAVPFFFFSSGFLLAKKINGGQSAQLCDTCIQHKQCILINYQKRMLRLYLIWTAIYLPITLAYYFSERIGILKSCYDFFRGLVFVGEHYNSWILWYLLSAIYALFLVRLMVRRKYTSRRWICICIAIFAMWIGLVFLLRYDGKLPAILSGIKFLWLRTFGSHRILEGFFCIPIGMLLYGKYQAVFKTRFIVIILLISVCVGMLIPTEIEFLISIPIAFCIFIWSCSVKWKNRNIYTKFRNMSTCIYFVHLYVWTIFCSIAYRKMEYGIIPFIVTLTGSIVISIIYVWFLQYKKRKNHPAEIGL